MNGYNGAILSYDERDILGGSLDLSQFPDITSETNGFNQNEFALAYGYCLCTNYAPIGMLADNTGLVLNTKQRQDTVKLRSEMKDFDSKVGGYLIEGVKNIKKYAESIGKKVNYIRISTRTQDFWDLYNKGYRINIGITVGETFLSDAQDNGQLDNTSFGQAKFGHSTTVKKLGKDCIVDNYKDVLKYNTYSVKDLKSLIDNGIIYEFAYVIWEDKQNLIDNLKKQIMEAIKLESAKAFVKRGHTNGERPQENITREEMWAVLERVLVANNLK